MDFFKNIFQGTKDFFSNFFNKKQGTASMDFYAPFGINRENPPTKEQQELLRIYPQLSAPPPKTGIEVFKVPSASSPTPSYQYIPPKAPSPMTGDSIIGTNPPPVRPLITTPTTTAPTSPEPTTPTSTTPPTEFATGKPTAAGYGA